MTLTPPGPLEAPPQLQRSHAPPRPPDPPAISKVPCASSPPRPNQPPSESTPVVRAKPDNTIETPATSAIPGYLIDTWKADPVHSEIALSVRHLMVSKTHGRFTNYDVTLVTGEGPLDSTVTATIDLASIDTGFEMRDNHLRSADYF